MKKIGLILADMSTPIEKSAQVDTNALNAKRCFTTPESGRITTRKGLIALDQIGFWSIMNLWRGNDTTN